MNAQTTNFIQSLLKMVGMALAAHGATKAADFINSEDVIGIILALVGLIASHLSNRPTALVAKANAVTNADGSVKVPLLLAFLIPALMFGGVGCNTNQQTVAYKTLYTVEKTTVAAYDGYTDSIIRGISTTNALPRVSHAFNIFQGSYLLALDAVQYNTNAVAPLNLITESGDVINLINQVKGK